MPGSLTDNSFLGKSLSEAYALTTDAFNMEVSADGTTTKQFLMTNATYVGKQKADDENNQVVCATYVPTLYKTEAEAAGEGKSIAIYVERVAAKVELADNTGAADASSTVTNQNVNGENKDLAVEILGWTLAGTNKKSYVMKKVPNAWITAAPWTATETVTGWNSTDNKRSYWAEDPNYTFTSADEYTGSTPVLNAKTFADATTTASTSEGSVNFEYCHENTFDATMFADRTPAFDWHVAATYALVAAQMKIKTATGTEPAENLFRLMGVFYKEADYLNKAINDVTASHPLYRKEGETISQIKSTDVKVIDATGAKAGPAKVQVGLTDEAKAFTWYSDDTCTTEITDAATTIDGYFSEMQAADGFKKGKMYYIIPIKHLNPNDKQTGSYGVVRNHVYKLSVNNIYNLGHAVWDPDAPITPTDNPETYYLAATLNILSWHIVNQNVDL